ncbi:Cytochrome c551 peroxidase precursor [compost metagenome]
MGKTFPRRPFWVLAVLTLFVAAPAVGAPGLREVFGGLSILPEVASPPSNPLTPAKVELGKTLFFDPRLSGDGSLACVSCHVPGLAWADGRAKGVGYQGKELSRNVPSLLNAAYYVGFFHDGRAGTLEEQALGPLFNPDEMNATASQVVSTLTGIPEYRARFQEAFGTEPSVETLGKALAAFERTLISKDSAFDRWVSGEEGALSPQAKRGLDLFTGKADCTACHKGPNFSDDKFHNIGVPGSGTRDKGRFEVTRDPDDLGAFKTPSLRNVALTAPYMHNGSIKTLHEAVKHYEEVDLDFPNLDPLIDHWGLTDEEIDAVVAFLESLTGKPPKVEAPRLPR